MKVQLGGKIHSKQCHTFDSVFFLAYSRKPKLPKSLIFDRRILPQNLSPDEKIKHQHFAQRYNDEVNYISSDH